MCKICSDSWEDKILITFEFIHSVSEKETAHPKPFLATGQINTRKRL